MLVSAIVIFAFAAVGGLILAAHVLRGRFAPWLLSGLHAALGAAGLVVLAVAVVQGIGQTWTIVSLLTLVVAALGGFFLASLHLRKRLPPKGIVVLHAVLAVTGFGILLFAAFGAPA